MNLFCPLCGGPAEIVGEEVRNVRLDGDVYGIVAVDLECHNDPGCPILECRVEVPEKRYSK